MADLLLDAYRILVVPFDVSIKTFHWDTDGNTWFSWNQNNVNSRNRLFSGYVAAEPNSWTALHQPDPTTMPESTLVDFKLSVKDPLISTFTGDLYCLLKVQSEPRSKRLPTLQPRGTLSQGNGNLLYNADASVYTRGNDGIHSGTFSTAFCASGIGANDDIGQVLYKFSGILANQTQANLDNAGAFTLQIRC